VVRVSIRENSFFSPEERLKKKKSGLSLLKSDFSRAKLESIRLLTPIV